MRSQRFSCGDGGKAETRACAGRRDENQGRNTIWLAQQGWNAAGSISRMTPWRSPMRMPSAWSENQEPRSKRIEDFDFGETLDLIVLSYAGCGFPSESIQARLESRRHSRRRSLSRGRDKRSPHWRLHLWIGKNCLTFSNSLRTGSMRSRSRTPIFAREPMRASPLFAREKADR